MESSYDDGSGWLDANIISCEIYCYTIFSHRLLALKVVKH